MMKIAKLEPIPGNQRHGECELKAEDHAAAPWRSIISFAAHTDLG